jgi:hypothetical protein
MNKKGLKSVLMFWSMLAWIFLTMFCLLTALVDGNNIIGLIGLASLAIPITILVYKKGKS